MSDLIHKHCVPCEGGMPPLSKDRAQELLKDLDGNWQIVDGKVTKELYFNTFPAAIKFVDSVAQLAESEGHHPDMLINYRKVTFSLMTYAIHGLSENDFVLAAKIQALFDKEQ